MSARETEKHALGMGSANALHSIKLMGNAGHMQNIQQKNMHPPDCNRVAATQQNALQRVIDVPQVLG